MYRDRHTDMQICIDTHTNNNTDRQTYIHAHRQANTHYTNKQLGAWWDWWLIGRFDAFRPKCRGSESRSRRYVGTLGKSFTRSCVWRFGVKLRAVSGVPPSSSGLEEAL